MIAGHLATALVAKQQVPRGSLAYYLVISQLPDLLWHAFHFAGLEPTLPANPMVASLDTMQAEMTYSHDLLPTLGWMVLATVVGRALFSDWRPALAGGALVVVHTFCDALSGYPHHVFGPESVTTGLGLYRTSPYLALVVEGVFLLGVMGWVFRADAQAGIRRSRSTRMVWAAVFVGGLVAMFPTADLSFVELTGVEPVAALSGALIPSLVVMYLGMMAALVWADAQPTESIREG